MELKNILIEPGSKTPLIDFNPHTGELIFEGKSIPENAVEFYEDLHKWIRSYSKNPKLTTNLRLNLDYFNTASSGWLAKIIGELCSVKKDGYTLVIHLYFNIEDFDTMHQEDLSEALSPIMDMIGSPDISIGIKVHGVGDRGEIIKESMVFI